MTSPIVSKGQKYVDLAELSMSGSLVPSVPTKLLVKFNPPKITLQYYFEQNQHQQFLHEIKMQAEMIQKESVQDIVSHLYVTEAYYFNPKQVRREQLLRLVQMIKDNIHQDGEFSQGIMGSANPAMSIQNNSEEAETDSQNGWNRMPQRKLNFFERKRWLNYDVPKQPQTSAVPSSEGDETQQPQEDESRQQSGPMPNSGALRSINNTRRRLNQIATPEIADMPSTETSGLTRQKNNIGTGAMPLPPLRGRHGPISDPQFMPHNNNRVAMPAFPQMQQRREQQQLELEQQQEVQAHEIDVGSLPRRLPTEDEPDHQDPNQVYEQEFVDGEEAVNDDGLEDQGLLEDEPQEGTQDYGDEEDAQSVYMLNGEVMRLIQIEGKEGMFLMSKNGCIYDMNGNEIGRANTACLEEFNQGGEGEQTEQIEQNDQQQYQEEDYSQEYQQ